MMVLANFDADHVPMEVHHLIFVPNHTHQRVNVNGFPDIFPVEYYNFQFSVQNNKVEKCLKLTCLPFREHNHHPSKPAVFCSRTVSKSPFLKDNSSGASAALSNNALATQFCKHLRLNIIE